MTAILPIPGMPYKIDAKEDNVIALMDVLLNRFSISAKGELQSLCWMMGKTMSLFGC